MRLATQIILTFDRNPSFEVENYDSIFNYSMRKAISIVILFIPSLIVSAQPESKGSDTKIKNETLSFLEKLSIPQLSFPINQQKLTFPAYIPIDKTFNFFPGSTPQSNQYAFDFGFQQVPFIFLSNNLSIYLSKKEETYQDIGSVYVAQASLVWKINNKLTATGGAFLNRHITPMDIHAFTSHGFSSLLQYSVTKKLQLNIYGNYLNYNPIDPYTNMNSLFTQTKVGANITYIKDESRKIGIGLDHQYNVSTEQWEPVYGTHITYKFPKRK